MLLLGKDIRCYEYVDSWEKLKEKLPAKARFFSKLRSLTVKILYNMQDILISFTVDIDLMKDILQNVILTLYT